VKRLDPVKKLFRKTFWLALLERTASMRHIILMI
jgi:hypothetical protein